MKKSKQFFSMMLMMMMLVGSIHANEATTDLIRINTVKGKDDRGTFNLQYPELTPQFKTPKRAEINKQFKNEFLTNQFCMSDAENKKKLLSSNTIEIMYVSEKLVSISNQYSSYCGGPYPNDGTQYYTYSVISGNPLNLFEEVTAPKVLKTFLAERFKQQAPIENADDCKEMYTIDELEKIEPQFYVTEKNVVLKQSYPHAIQSCEFELTLSRCSINPFLKKGSVLVIDCPMSTSP